MSGDLNYRSNLWQFGKAPHEIMPALMELTQVMIAGVRDFNQCLQKDFIKFKEVRKYAFEAFPKFHFHIEFQLLGNYSPTNYYLLK